MVFKIRRNTTFFENILIFVLVYFLSSILLSYYTQSDQLYYNKFYDYVQLNIATESIHKLYESMYSFIGAKEPVYFAVVYLGVCLGLSKIFVMALVNGLLAIFMYTYLKYKGCYKLYSFLIVTFSFYFLVLYTGAERLKFGFLFGILSLLLYNRAKIKLSYLCVLLSILSHFSMILFYMPVLLYKHSKFKLTNKKFIVFCIIIVISLFVFVLFKNIILHKLSAYLYNTTISDVLKSLVIGLIFIFFIRVIIELGLLLFLHSIFWRQY